MSSCYILPNFNFQVRFPFVLQVAQRVQEVHRRDEADRDDGQRVRQTRARPHPQQLLPLHEVP